MQTLNLGRVAVQSTHGMVAAQHMQAAQAGARVLGQGGNAIDAAVTTALMLSVVEPWLSGIGGGGFLLYADPASGQVDTLDFNMVAPRDLNAADYPLVQGTAPGGNWFQWPEVLDERNASGYHSICVPGAVAGLAQALERFGTISFADALAPAIEAAQRGLEMDWFAALSISIDAAGLAKHPASATLFLDQGRAPRVAERPALARRAMPAMARTLTRLAQAGARDFYEGQIAAQLVQDLQAGGSAISATDLAAYQPRWDIAQSALYRGHQVHVMGGLSGGPTLLQALAELSAQTLVASGTQEALALAHAGALRNAYQHRLAHMGHAATAQVGCTSHLSVVDAQGRMVSLTNTLLSRFGSKVVLPQTGFLLNNGMMWFDPRPGHPNAIAPGAKPLANMCPVLLTEQGRPWLALGAAGGRTIVPTVMQIISFMLDKGLSLEHAFLHPRIEASGPKVLVSDQAPAVVAQTMAARFPTEVVADTIYPVQFSVPSAVQRAGASNIGMSHRLHPWAGVAVADATADPN